MLAKHCRMTTGQLADRLLEAKRHIPFVQANLIAMPQDDGELVRRWRKQMRDAGVWANDPVPLFPYPARRITAVCGASRTTPRGSGRTTTI